MLVSQGITDRDERLVFPLKDQRERPRARMLEKTTECALSHHAYGGSWRRFGPSRMKRGSQCPPDSTAAWRAEKREHLE